MRDGKWYSTFFFFKISEMCHANESRVVLVLRCIGACRMCGSEMERKLMSTMVLLARSQF